MASGSKSTNYSIKPTSFYGRKPSGILRIQAPVLIKFADDDSDLCSSGGDSSDEENITDCELFLPIPSSSSEEVDSSDENADSNDNQLLSILGRANGSADKKEGATVVQATNKPNANGKKPAKKSQLLWKVKSLPNKQEDHKFKGTNKKWTSYWIVLVQNCHAFIGFFQKSFFKKLPIRQCCIPCKPILKNQLL
ncbi:uncharacterized protein LOC124809216 [Hydra vulgaris]|uniref:uncharacterized protein LOC124809216 n=1 Tax=Hydra vulgaris TaxID=6087 RepID=UPI001F5ECD8A|nr:uncharacterized protein LOC124809216 [Hydra vulgaris]